MSVLICVTFVLIVLILCASFTFCSYMNHCSENGVGMFENPIHGSRRMQRLEKCIERLEKILETEGE